jgi:hypothetical protein
MKVLIILAALLFLVQNTSAAQMSGFAARYYQDDGTTPEEPTEVHLYPTITIGKKTVQMEVTHLADISSTPVNKDSSPHAGSVFMTTMTRITGLFLITKWVQDC